VKHHVQEGGFVMSFFVCPCDYCITDRSDNLSYKGYIIPDQDFEVVIEGIEKSSDGYSPFDYMLEIYQCPKCNRIHMSRDWKHFVSFSPDEDGSGDRLISLGDG
jgi:hypothetical protein